MITIMLSTLFGCQNTEESLTVAKNEKKRISGKHHKELWTRVRDNYNMTSQPKDKEAHQKPEVQKYVKQYTQKEQTLQKISAQATPYLYHIIEALEERGMPGELALLPVIESAFQPQATSHRGAAGLWQFIASTGRQYGLKQNAWYDQRRDIRASTVAALDYLSFLHEEFDRNWMLALAAYNAGEGTVRRAINRNLKQGKPTSFWDLKLPKETKEYVPKLLALAKVIEAPEKHDVQLPEIENKPYFVPVMLKESLNLQKAAQLADIHINELKRLNAGYKRGVIPTKGVSELLIPVASKETFEYNFSQK